VADGPQRYVLAIAYKAGKDPRIKKGADGGRDWFSAESLELAAWSYLAKGSPQVGIGHIDGTTGAATVVESYVWRGPDWDLGDGIVVTKGDWLIGMILDERSWDLAQQGKLTGLSPQGTAKRRTVRR
jgi:Putative phage serine protease XkdF